MILIVGEFGSTDYLLYEIKRSVPREFSYKVHSPVDAYSSVIKGAIATGIKSHFSSLNNRVQSIPAGRNLLTHFPLIGAFYIEVQEAFRQGIDPEQYRIMSLDGSSLCNFVAKKIIGRRVSGSVEKPIKLSLQKFLSPGQPLEFSHSLYMSYAANDSQYTRDPSMYRIFLSSIRSNLTRSKASNTSGLLR